jgi:acylphosphatase
MSSRERLEATIHGDVQGVGFRWFVRREAARLAVAGWVANEPDGTVIVVAEGAPADIDLFLSRLADGPPGAHVVRVDTHRMPARGTAGGFEIRAGSHSGD